jgi:hypothetical protein
MLSLSRRTLKWYTTSLGAVYSSYSVKVSPIQHWWNRFDNVLEPLGEALKESTCLNTKP